MTHTAKAVAAQHNLASLITDRAESQSVALTWAGGGLTYAELVIRTGQARLWLEARGLVAGDRVALALPNVPEMVILYYALVSLGAVAVPLHPLLSSREVVYQLEDSGAKLLIAGEGTRVADQAEQTGRHLGSELKIEILGLGFDFAAPRVGPWEPRAVHLDAPAVLLYTSGTTGAPKGATLTHANMLSNARACAEVFGFRGDDTIFGGLPLFHAFGQTVSMNAVFAAGASVALLPQFTSGGAAQLCASAGVTVYAAVPTMYGAWAAYLATDPALAAQLRGTIRFGVSGGAALPASVHRQIEQILAFPIYEGYGLSETAPVVAFNRAEFGLLIGSVGRALPGVRVKVVDSRGQELGAGQPGELWVAGPNVMAGYWNNPQATQQVMQGEWFATGDVAKIDEQGNIFIVDRLKDMILRNGNSIYPREIEDVLDIHSGVRQAAVVGVPCPRVGEEVVAVIVPHEQLDEAQMGELVAALDALARAELAAYKRPRRYEVRQSLPLGPTGKILKRELAGTIVLEG
ncbi:AMP-binding protein [Rothia sp. P4278]|uniref:AMP-binding protein n=1 Tax=Rothia sp. P4278 TaxID=3402658 RepID=UPI003AEF1270